MKNFLFALAIACLAMSLAGCSAAVGDADAGPNPGGGFYDGANFNVGHRNPSPGSYDATVYTSVGQANP